MMFALVKSGSESDSVGVASELQFEALRQKSRAILD
jgi:hypothetical protein